MVAVGALAAPAVMAIVFLAAAPTDPVSRTRGPILKTHPVSPASPINGKPTAKAPAAKTPVAPVRPTPARPAPAAAPLTLQDVERASDLLDRLRLIDRSLATTDADQVVMVIERLLDRPPGKVEEAQSLKVALIARLGLFPKNERAVSRLVATAGPSQSRSERLVAIEALRRDGPVPVAALHPLARIADTDQDSVVAKKARWALGRSKDG